MLNRTKCVKSYMTAASPAAKAATVKSAASSLPSSPFASIDVSQRVSLRRMCHSWDDPESP